MRAELARMIEAHRRVLDQLATGVAIFNADRKLIFYNTAFRSLFDLDAGLLDQAPSDNAVLDTLRTGRKLPEEQDFRQWKNQLHEAYRAVEPKEHMWHLPDGRTLRVVTTPNPEGGVTYLYDDVTERLAMHRRYDALIKVQSETLDHLAEAVAVFGSDGRVRLHNPAFQRMWKLAPEALDQHPHIEAVTAWCQALHDDNTVWRNLRGTVTAIDNREPIVARIERRDGVMIDMTTMPLPDGATLVTFQDVTDTVNVERALVERNEALVAADSIKIEFVHHVSYELRSPLTNIIGFANLLGDPAFGPLSDKQHEYLGYITISTNALLALINNILDLATIDAGAMSLNLSEVDIRASMEAAAEGVADRLVKNNLKLDIRAAAGIGSFTADQRRLRQILFNLLSNAVGFSPPGGTVTLAAERRADAVVFSVTDRGPGIPARAEGQGVRLVRDQLDGLAAPRHRPRAIAGALLRRAARRHGDDRLGRRPGHDGDLRVPAGAGEEAKRGLTFPEHDKGLRGDRGGLLLWQLSAGLPVPAHVTRWRQVADPHAVDTFARLRPDDAEAATMLGERVDQRDGADTGDAADRRRTNRRRRRCGGERAAVPTVIEPDADSRANRCARHRRDIVPAIIRIDAFRLRQRGRCNRRGGGERENRKKFTHCDAPI